MTNTEIKTKDHRDGINNSAASHNNMDLSTKDNEKSTQGFSGLATGWE